MIHACMCYGIEWSLEVQPFEGEEYCGLVRVVYIQGCINKSIAARVSSPCAVTGCPSLLLCGWNNA